MKLCRHRTKILVSNLNRNRYPQLVVSFFLECIIWLVKMGFIGTHFSFHTIVANEKIQKSRQAASSFKISWKRFIIFSSFNWKFFRSANVKQKNLSRFSHLCRLSKICFSPKDIKTQKSHNSYFGRFDLAFNLWLIYRVNHEIARHRKNPDSAQSKWLDRVICMVPLH